MDKIKIRIKALQTLSVGDGLILQPGQEAEIERTQEAIDTAVALALYELVGQQAHQEATPNG